jgi:hypothetical protein
VRLLRQCFGFSYGAESIAMKTDVRSAPNSGTNADIARGRLRVKFSISVFRVALELGHPVTMSALCFVPRVEAD